MLAETEKAAASFMTATIGSIFPWPRCHMLAVAVFTSIQADFDSRLTPESQRPEKKIKPFLECKLTENEKRMTTATKWNGIYLPHTGLIQQSANCSLQFEDCTVVTPPTSYHYKLVLGRQKTCNTAERAHAPQCRCHTNSKRGQNSD